MKKRLRPFSCLQSDSGKILRRKVFADEEAIETDVGIVGLVGASDAGKYSLMKKRLRPMHQKKNTAGIVKPESIR